MNSLPRCFLPASLWEEGGSVPVPAEEAHHLSRVLRLRAGEAVRAFDGEGREADGVLESAAGGTLRLRLGGTIRNPAPPVRLTLYQALLKSERMDEVIEKAVELGAAELVPLAAARSVVRLEGGKSGPRVERWRKIALGAARQSGNPFFMRVREVMPVEASAVESAGLDLALAGSLEPGAAPLLDALKGVPGRRGLKIGLWIGPEGDWSPDEHAALMARGVKPVRLGPLVLRAETAAFYGLSVIGAAVTAENGLPAGR